MANIVFVDDEPNILSGLRRLFGTHKTGWKVSFLSSGEEVLNSLKETPIDILVSDMRMPQMDGAELLNNVHRLSPATIRMGLSGFSEQSLVLRGIGAIHQLLSKPCYSGQLISTLEGLLQARSMLPREIADRVVGLDALPCQGKSLAALRQELTQKQVSLPVLGEIVAGDLGLSGRILQFVHSGFLGLPRPVSGSYDACMMLGIDRVRLLVDHNLWCAPANGEDLPALSKRSARVAKKAREWMQVKGANPRLCDLAHLAGSVHNIGELVAQHIALEPTAGVDYSEVGALLLRLWGLPAEVVEAVTLQTGSIEAQALSPAHAVAHALRGENGGLHALGIPAQDTASR